MDHLRHIRDAARRAVLDGDAPALQRLAAGLTDGDRSAGAGWLLAAADRLNTRATR